MIFLIDLDGTIRDVYTSYIQRAKIVAPDIEWPTQGPQEYWFLKRYAQRKEYNNLVDIWHTPGFFENALPYAYAIERVKDIAKHHTVFLITEPTASDTAHSENYRWVKHWFGPDWARDQLFQMPDRTPFYAHYLIDDKPRIEGVMKPYWRHIIYNQPYNMCVLSPRLMTWEDATIDDIIHLRG